MDAATWGFIGTLVGAVVGSLASIITTVISGRNERKKLAQADSRDRIERARNFQRQTLLELQDALSVHMRLIARAHFQDARFYRENPESNEIPRLGEELDYEILHSNKKLSILIERVFQDDLREELRVTHRQMNEVTWARSAPESESRLLAGSKQLDALMKSLGTSLRSTY